MRYAFFKFSRFQLRTLPRLRVGLPRQDRELVLFFTQSSQAGLRLFHASGVLFGPGSRTKKTLDKEFLHCIN